MTKLQLTLTPSEAQVLSFQAQKFGYDLTRYVKYLISKTVDSIMSEPVIPMSAKTEKLLSNSLAKYSKGKLSSVNTVNELFEL